MTLRELSSVLRGSANGNSGTQAHSQEPLRSSGGESGGCRSVWPDWGLTEGVLMVKDNSEGCPNPTRSIRKDCSLTGSWEVPSNSLECPVG